MVKTKPADSEISASNITSGNNSDNNMAAYVGLNHMSFDHRSGEWKTFKLKLTNSFIAGDVSSDLKMKAILITALSDETLSLLASLCVPLDIKAKSFNDLIKLLDAHYTPVNSYFSARYEFYRAEKNPMETVAEWAARVRTLSIPCGFGTKLNIVLRDIFTLGLNKQFKERLFEEDKNYKQITNKIITMNKMMDIALAKEMASKNTAKNNQEPNKVNFVKGNKFTHMKSTKKIINKQYSKNSQKDQAGETHKQKCRVCGRQNHKSNDCKYKGYACNLCHLVGHLAPMCKNKNKFNQKIKLPILII